MCGPKSSGYNHQRKYRRIQIREFESLNEGIMMIIDVLISRGSGREKERRIKQKAHTLSRRQAHTLLG